MKIAIMTRGRVAKQETLKYIPKKWQEHTALITPQSEDHWPNIRDTDVQQHMVPDDINSYSLKMQYILDGNIWPEDNKILIMDDDLYFNRYKNGKLCVIKDKEELNPMFDLLDEMMEEVALVGVHPRMMAQAHKGSDKLFEWNSKIVTIQGVNRALIKRGMGGIPRITSHPILADVFLNCALLSRGIANARITNFFVDWLPSQASGGCDYRTAEMQREACESVARLYAPYAETVVKEPKTAKWLGGSRTDLKIRWKDLYQAGLRGEFR